jgi:hypothetical protein
MNKGHYGHPGGILHSAIHVALTPLVYLVIAPLRSCSCSASLEPSSCSTIMSIG